MYQLNSIYKIFWDLKFIARDGINIPGVSYRSDTIHARLMFNNGYGISVVRGGIVTIGNTKIGSDDVYEIAVLDKDGKLDYSTPITEDVITDLTQDEVTEYMIKIQQL